MRLHDPSLDAAQLAEIEQFVGWILSIGDGMIPTKRKERSMSLHGSPFLTTC
jgi:hypothetical protein